MDSRIRLAALFTARRADAVRIRVGVTVGQIAADPLIPLERLHVWITVTNLGRRPFMLQGIGWKSGLHPRWGFLGRILGRVYAVQNVGASSNGPNLPLKMNDGDVAHWRVPLDQWQDNNGPIAHRHLSAAWHRRLHLVQDVLQGISEHPASRVAELTPRLWRRHFSASPLRSALRAALG